MSTATFAAAVILNVSLLGAAPQDAARQAFDRSVQTGRPLVFLFGANWCPACRVMKDKTLPQVEKSGGMRGVEYAYIDIDRRPDFARRYLRGNSVPQLIRFDRKGEKWQSQYLIGSQSPERVSKFLATTKDGIPASYTNHKSR